MEGPHSSFSSGRAAHPSCSCHSPVHKTQRQADTGQRSHSCSHLSKLEVGQYFMGTQLIFCLAPPQRTLDCQSQNNSGSKDKHGLLRWLSSKESTCNARDSGSIPGSGRSPGEGNGKFLPGKFHGQRSLAGYIKSMNLQKSWTRLRD